MYNGVIIMRSNNIKIFTIKKKYENYIVEYTFYMITKSFVNKQHIFFNTKNSYEVNCEISIIHEDTENFFEENIVNREKFIGCFWYNKKTYHSINTLCKKIIGELYHGNRYHNFKKHFIKDFPNIYEEFRQCAIRCRGI